MQAGVEYAWRPGAQSPWATALFRAQTDMGSAMLEGWNVAHSERGDLAVPQQTSVERCLGFSFLQGTTTSTSFSSCLFCFSSLFSLTHSSLSAHLSLLFSSLLFSSLLFSSLLFSSLLFSSLRISSHIFSFASLLVSLLFSFSLLRSQRIISLCFSLSSRIIASLLLVLLRFFMDFFASPLLLFATLYSLLLLSRRFSSLFLSSKVFFTLLLLHVLLSFFSLSISFSSIIFSVSHKSRALTAKHITTRAVETFRLSTTHLPSRVKFTLICHLTLAVCIFWRFCDGMLQGVVAPVTTTHLS